MLVFFFYFFSFFSSHTVPLSATLIWSSHLSNFSQAHSLKLSPLCFTFTTAGLTHLQCRRHRSSTLATHHPSQAADQPQTYVAIRLRPTGRAMRSKPRERCSVIGNQSIDKDVDNVSSIDAWVCIRFVLGLSPVGDFVWYGLRI